MRSLAKVWLDGWGCWLGYFHPHWAWLDRLDADWGDPLCAGYCIGWSRISDRVYRHTGYRPGDWFEALLRKARGGG